MTSQLNLAWTTKVRQHPERAVPQRAEEFLTQGYVAHVGFEQDGRPVCDSDALPLRRRSSRPPVRSWRSVEPNDPTPRFRSSGVRHGHRTRRAGVFSRRRYHSANYRCVMCFGRGSLVEDDDLKQSVFTAMTSRYFPGRTRGTGLCDRSQVAPGRDASHRDRDRGDEREDARGRSEGPTRC